MILTAPSKVITGGINLIYYSEPGIKMSFLENLFLEFNNKNTLVVDFDTQFTNLEHSNYRRPEFVKFGKVEIFLPYEIAFEKVLDKISDYDKYDSVLVMDSLNGLIDYFGSYNYYGYVEDIRKTSHQNRNAEKESHLETNKNAGHKGLCLLKILLQNHFLKKVPIVVTSYISQRGIDKLIADLLTLEGDLDADRNHFRRFSNSISFLADPQFDASIFVTILKKKSISMAESSSHLDVYPHSIKLNDI